MTFIAEADQEFIRECAESFRDYVQCDIYQERLNISDHTLLD